MKKLLLFSSLLVLLEVSSCRYPPVGHPPVSKDFLIIMDSCVGPIRLGEPLDSAIKVFGHPVVADTGNGQVLATWYTGVDSTPSNKISVFCEKDVKMSVAANFKIKKILVTDSSYRTRLGMAAKDSFLHIARVYIVQPRKKFSCNNIKYWDYGTSRGLNFIIDPKGVCEAVIVHDASVSDSTVYLPFYR